MYKSTKNVNKRSNFEPKAYMYMQKKVREMNLSVKLEQTPSSCVNFC